MIKKLENYVFIDAQNLFISAQKRGWKVDWRKFYFHLKEKYLARKVFIFIGYLESNRRLYEFLIHLGYTLNFKQTLMVNGKVKGNVDVDLTVKALTTMDEYNQAVIVTNDGDFLALIRHLESKNKLRMILSTHKFDCSLLIKRAFPEKVQFLEDFRTRLSRKGSRSS
mgnify:CR=1 FL=1